MNQHVTRLHSHARPARLLLVALLAGGCAHTPRPAPAPTVGGREYWPAGELRFAEEGVAEQPGDIDALRRRGIARLAMDDFRGAIADLNRVIAKSPADAVALVLRGVARDRRGDRAGALADFRRALAPPPATPLVNAPDSPGVGGQIEVWRYDADMVREADRRIAQDPRDASAFEMRGDARDAMGDFDGAVADFEQAMLLNPRGDTAIRAMHSGFHPPNYFMSRKRARAAAGQAVLAASRAIAANPGDAAAHLARGIARLARDERKLALADFDRAVTLAPRNAAALRYRALARGWLEVFEVYTGYDRMAIHQADRALTAAPNDAVAIVARGSYRSDLGDFAGAIADFDRAIALRPAYAGTYLNRALARRAAGDAAGARVDIERAIAEGDRAIARNPRDAHAFANRGNAKEELGDRSGALADLDRAVVLNPRDVDPILTRGLIRHRQGDRAGASADFDRAVSLTSNHAGQAIVFALARYAVGDRAGARAAIDETFDRSYASTDPHAFSARGAIRYALGDHDGGASDIARAIALVPNYHDRFLHDDDSRVVDVSARSDDRFIDRGTFKFERASFEAMMADFDRAIALAPADAVAYLHRGLARYEVLMDRAGALEDFERALALDPRSVDALAARAFVRWIAADADGAIADYSAMIALNPNDAEAYDRRAWVKAILKRDQAGASADRARATELVREGKGSSWQNAAPRLPSPDFLAPFLRPPPAVGL